MAQLAGYWPPLNPLLAQLAGYWSPPSDETKTYRATGRRRNSKCRLSSSSADLLVVVTVTFLLVLCVPTIQGSSSCELMRCWELYETSKQALDVRDEILHRKYQPTPEEQERHCTSLRTIHHCLATIRPHCVGNLNFHSAHKGAESQMKHANCNLTGAVYEPSADPRLPIMRPCSYRGRKVHRHCGLFGDPHLRTFNEEFHTCRVQGAWPLINNDYLVVQVTNDPVGLHSATATSKLTVVIKGDEQCGAHEYVTYQAQTENLPATFDDGSTHFGRDASVQIKEIKQGKHIEIYIRYIDTTLVVRQIGRYFTFAAKMPEDIVSESVRQDVLQLCTAGCPLSEQINYKQFLAQKQTQYNNALDEYHQSSLDIAMSRDRAIDKCRRVNVVDFYFDSCVFDLLTTGDANFTLAASRALLDLKRLDPQTARLSLKNRTHLEDYGDHYRSNAVRVQTPNLLHHTSTLLLVLCMFLLNS